MSGRVKGVLCIVASAAGFALMSAFVRLCDDFGGEVSSFQKSFFRNLVAFFAALAAFPRSRPAACAPLASAKARRLLLARSAAGCLGIFGNFYALSKIPIADAMALNKTAPFFTVAFSWLFLREKAGLRGIAALVAAFAGVLLVVRPGFRAEEPLALACALGGGLGAGLAYTCVRELGVMGVPGPFIVLFFSAFSCVASVPLFAFDPSPVTFAQTACLLGAGCGAALGQFGVTAAYRFAKPRDIAVFDYTGVVFAGILGLAMFGQRPDAYSVAGYLVIAGASLFSARAGSARPKRPVLWYNRASRGETSRPST